MSSMMFYGFAAWVGSMTSPTRCNWWPDDPNNFPTPWDPTKLIPTDLGMTLTKSVPPASAQVDDGMTTIGPWWPQGATVGALFLAKPYYDGLAAGIKPARIPPKGGGHDYEYSSVVYYAGENGNRRFNGLYARVAAISGTLTQLQIWNPGTGNTAAPAAGTWWIDLRASTDPASSAINATSPVNTTGSIYIDTGTLATINIQQPKIPPYKGTFRFPKPQ